MITIKNASEIKEQILSSVIIAKTKPEAIKEMDGFRSGNKYTYFRIVGFTRSEDELEVQIDTTLDVVADGIFAKVSNNNYYSKCDFADGFSIDDCAEICNTDVSTLKKEAAKQINAVMYHAYSCACFHSGTEPKPFVEKAIDIDTNDIIDYCFETHYSEVLKKCEELEADYIENTVKPQVDEVFNSLLKVLEQGIKS